MKRSVTCCFDPGASSLAGLLWPRKNTFNSLLEYRRRNRPIVGWSECVREAKLIINKRNMKHAKTNELIKAKLLW